MVRSSHSWPLLGNYGIAPGISESAGVWPRGWFCRELMLEQIIVIASEQSTIFFLRMVYLGFQESIRALSRVEFVSTVLF